MLWTIPIEPLEGRYSADWNRWFSAEWGDSTRFIEGDSVPTGISTGDFLDVFNTHKYKASQVSKIATLLQSGEIKENDCLFFHDLWFPLEQVFYMLDALGLDVKVAGFMHCGSYSRHDLLHRSGMNDWAADVERGWFRRLDKIMVFSEHHKRQLMNLRGVPEFKVRVVPFPANLSELEYHRGNHKSHRVVWPHRPGPDKCSGQGSKLLAKLEAANVNVFKTWERCSTKAEYYHALGHAEFVVCWPPSETFGIAGMEAGYLGAMPIVPNRLSYRDLYSHRFDTVDNAFEYIMGRKPIEVHGPWENAHTGFDVVRAELACLTSLEG